MCTALTYQTDRFYFGRTLDLERVYDTSITVTPRNFPFAFKNGLTLSSHHAIIGVAVVSQDYPLYFDAVNEYGLCVAGLNFPDNAVYRPLAPTMENIAPYELIPWLLGQCKNVAEALALLSRINLWHRPFCNAFPLSPLHWLLADRHQSVTLEPLEAGLRVCQNPVGVLTNNPPFDYHMCNLANYMRLSATPPVCSFHPGMELKPYSLGMGALGLPGDPSSASRFVRAAFTKFHSTPAESDVGDINQFFHILESVAQSCGVTVLPNGLPEYTQYSSCCSCDTGIYHYTTYETREIMAVDLHKEDLQGRTLRCYPMLRKTRLHHQN